MAEEDNIPLAAPVLNYATFDADGLPAFVAEAESLIQKCAKPRSILPFFRDADQACKYIGKSLRRRFSLSETTALCTHCGQPAGHVVGVEWYVTMGDKFYSLKLRRRPASAQFITHHSICEACTKPWFRAMLWQWRLSQFGRAISFLIYIGVVVLLFLPKQRFYRDLPFTLILVPFALLTILSQQLIRAWSRSTIPSGIRRLLPPSLLVVNVQLFYRDSGL